MIGWLHHFDSWQSTGAFIVLGVAALTVGVGATEQERGYKSGPWVIRAGLLLLAVGYIWARTAP